MQIQLDDSKTKELLTEIVIDLIQNRQEVIREILLDALEEVGLGKAIIEGRQNDFVSEEGIFTLLDEE
ncbi:ribbon-helix-helix protein, CopG family [Picosynechococcus sp. PCC 7117]|uniref:ribbon-helix-helix protein, CopG family n=1 Tax=Picosynechococcus sp. PCC 7117 TaxID=195498 RepID=UPI000810AAA4|nr:ribbon-helix-helix protein, CopG family [Picosynechococcus sp. PCC 7117]ANV86741.1 hypothetical protein AWQ22_04235 [Picosynechococcus sp. PCC 7117]